jgi:hypothetical protein
MFVALFALKKRSNMCFCSSSGIPIPSSRTLNKSSFSDPTPTAYNLDITGVINSGDTKVYYAGADGGLSSLPALGFNNGFNAYDEIILLKDNVIIDRVQLPNNVGYDYRRLTTVTGPNTTYTAAEWNRIETGENTYDGNLANMYANDVYDVISWLENNANTNDPKFNECESMGDILESILAFVKLNYLNISNKELF